MSKLPAFLIAAILCSALFSCNSTNTEKPAAAPMMDMTLDKQAAKTFLDSINGKFSEQIAAGDSVALASHYWPDAELLLDHSDAVKGTDVVHAWAGAIGMGIKELNLTTTDIAGNSDLMIETGRYEMKNAGKTLLDQGKYVVVWEKRNGEWKIYRDIGSTSMPAK